jgi:hypothetical protein
MLSDALHAYGPALDDETVAMLAYGTLTPAHASAFRGYVKTVRNAWSLDAILKGDAGQGPRAGPRRDRALAGRRPPGAGGGLPAGRADPDHHRRPLRPPPHPPAARVPRPGRRAAALHPARPGVPHALTEGATGMAAYVMASDRPASHRELPSVDAPVGHTATVLP